MSGLLLCDDLIFASRVAGTAQSLGLSVKVARSSEALLRLAEQEAPTGVLIDLANPGLDLPALLSRLREHGVARVMAYGSHVDTATLRAAREAGCDPVLPRSAFVEQLPTALPEWLGTAP
jgi:CheY-like chemotaxis protein